MIVRILGEGQYHLPDGERDGLEALDRDLVSAVEARDEAAFAAALTSLVERVRQKGERLGADEPAPSDLVVPFADASLGETEDLLADAGTEEG